VLPADDIDQTASVNEPYRLGAEGEHILGRLALKNNNKTSRKP